MIANFIFFGDDISSRIWRRNKTLNVSSQQSNAGVGGVMVRGCMAASGVGRLSCNEEKLNADYYEEILSSEMLPSAAEIVGRRYIVSWCKDTHGWLIRVSFRASRHHFKICKFRNWYLTAES